MLLYIHKEINFVLKLSIHLQNSLLYIFGTILNVGTWLSGEMQMSKGEDKEYIIVKVASYII